MLFRHVVEAHPLLPLDRPLLSWAIHDPDPSLDELRTVSDTAIARWQLRDEAVEVYSATKATDHLFGAFRRKSSAKMCEATHDLHLAEVFVRYWTHSPRIAAAWLGESAFPKLGFEIRRLKDPDAFIINVDGPIVRIVEFAGRYKTDHLAAFHQHCAGKAADRIATLLPKERGGILSRLYDLVGTDYEIW